MTFNEVLTYSSIAFMLLLLSIYYAKPTFKNVRTSLYKIMLIVTSLFTITELLPIYALIYMENSESILFVTWRIHWVIGIIWYLAFFMYCMVLFKKIDVKSVWNVVTYDLLNKISFGIFALFMIVYAFFLPFSGMDKENINYMPGRTAMYVAIFTFVIVTIVGFAIFVKIEISPK